VFGTTINHIKKTIDEKTYRKIEKLFLMKNRLVLQKSLLKKLKSIFEKNIKKLNQKL